MECRTVGGVSGTQRPGAATTRYGRSTGRPVTVPDRQLTTQRVAGIPAPCDRRGVGGVAEQRRGDHAQPPIIETLLELGAAPTFAKTYASPVERARWGAEVVASDASAPTEQLAAARANLEMLERGASVAAAETE